ncbi:exodeoxyribonuclease V subunit gamma, partial [Nocardioides sp. NPDC000441]|uniref:exodeoxyribonuclease V subunit gamma n=1 Tax=Nocardioides sp. NPDC000441 TaxID=3154256 RepID=UPI00332017AB
MGAESKDLMSAVPDRLRSVVVHLHRAPRTDLLADSLGELLSVPLGDPFATEVVVVPARGVERWLSQRLSHRLGAAEGRADGICAGVDFRSPWSLFAEVAGTGDEDPWAPESLTWPVLAAIDASLDEPWARPLAQHLGHGDTSEEGVRRRGRRLALARRLARGSRGGRAPRRGPGRHRRGLQPPGRTRDPGAAAEGAQRGDRPGRAGRAA